MDEVAHPRRSSTLPPPPPPSGHRHAPKIKRDERAKLREVTLEIAELEQDYETVSLAVGAAGELSIEGTMVRMNERFRETRKKLNEAVKALLRESRENEEAA